jgi:hypothetical protein
MCGVQQRMRSDQMGGRESALNQTVAVKARSM